MKKILIILTIGFLYGCGSFTKPLYTADSLTETRIFNDLDKTKNELFVISNDWMVDKFNCAECMIQFSDKDEGTIIGKYIIMGDIEYTYGIDTRIYAKLTVLIKENRANITITPTTDIYATDKSLEYIKNSINNLLTDYENTINKEKQDW